MTPYALLYPKILRLKPTESYKLDAKSVAASPSASLSVIEQRLDLVSQFVANPSLRETIVLLLRRSFDSQRLVQKFSLARGDADDLISLARTIEVTENVHRTLLPFSKESNLSCAETPSWNLIHSRLSLDGPRELAARIVDAIDEEGLLERERIDETETLNMAALAQDVLTDEGSPEDLEVLPKQVRKKAAMKKTNNISDRDPEDADTWVMRQRF